MMRIFVTMLACCLLFAGCGGSAAVESLEEVQVPQEAASPAPAPETAPAGVVFIDPGQQAEEEEEEPPFQPVFSAQSIPKEVMEHVQGSSLHSWSPVPAGDLSYLQVSYIDFGGETQIGEIIVHSDLADELLEIFQELYDAEFPIAEISLVDKYGADDNLSMAANNSYAFCNRTIAGTGVDSRHSYGAAVDINPVQNPYLAGRRVLPEEGQEYLDRTDIRPGMIVPGDICYNAFASRGWTWGGHWPSPDYQHFEKAV